MFNNEALKWTARNAAEIGQCIHEIISLTKDDLDRQRELARKYVEQYFHPVDPASLNQFLSV